MTCGRIARVLILATLLVAPTRAAVFGDWDAADLDGERLIDRGGADHHGVGDGAVKVDQLGRAALRFGSDTAAVRVTPTPGDGWAALSLTVVAHVDTVGEVYQGVAGRDLYGGPTGDVFGLLIGPDGNWRAAVTTEQAAALAVSPAVVGWHVVSLTYDGAALRLYVDGQLAAEKAASGALQSEPDTPFVIGAYSNDLGGFKGAVARVELRDDALSAEALAERAAWLPKADPNAGFTFAQVSDTHVTDTKSVEIVNLAVDSINADPRVAFSLWLGDLTQTSTSDQMVLARLTLDRLTRPRYVVRGNHDQSGGHYEREFGPLMQSLEYAGWRFLLADSNPGDDTPMAAEQRDWIREQLAGIDKQTPIVFCCHHPLMPSTKAYLMAESEQVIALFAEHNLKAVLTGHYHGNQEEIVAGVLYTTTACCATTRNNFDGTTAKGYRLFHCRDGAITSEFVTVSDEAGK